MSSSSKKARILVVDDSASTLEVIQRNLMSEGYQVFTASCVAKAVELLEQTTVDLVITDLKMPKVSGLDLVRHVRENLKNAEVMVITGYPSIEGAVEAVKTGAEEYMAKPFTDAELLSAVGRALEKLRMRSTGLPEGSPAVSVVDSLVGESEEMHRVHRAIAKTASNSATVLITGGSGTGKELIARAIHYNSARSAFPFAPVNCGGIPEGLLESELFGHVKGAFTGATHSRAGFFHAADGGTVFLDEVSETSPSMQVKLLRILQSKEICMVGSDRTRKVDVRILAATNKDLAALVEKGTFREDLFYRLHVIAILVPPLRNRGDDVLLLTRHFALKFAKEFDKPPVHFRDGALRALKDYSWPGNVRELENVIKRIIVMAEDEVIDIPDLPPLMRFSALRESGLNRTLAEVEVEYIRNVLQSVNDNKTRAADILGIDRKTLRQKLKNINPT